MFKDFEYKKSQKQKGKNKKSVIFWGFLTTKTKVTKVSGLMMTM